jgi:hypothetical protein
LIQDGEEAKEEVIVAHIREGGEGGGVVVRRFLKGKLLGKVRAAIWPVHRSIRRLPRVMGAVWEEGGGCCDPINTHSHTFASLPNIIPSQGGFAKCYWATCLETGEAFALKIVQKSSLVKSKARQKVRETKGLEDGGKGGGGVVCLGGGTPNEGRGRAPILPTFPPFPLPTHTHVPSNCKRRCGSTGRCGTGTSCASTTSSRTTRGPTSSWSSAPTT